MKLTKTGTAIFAKEPELPPPGENQQGPVAETQLTTKEGELLYLPTNEKHSDRPVLRCLGCSPHGEIRWNGAAWEMLRGDAHKYVSDAPAIESGIPGAGWVSIDDKFTAEEIP